MRQRIGGREKKCKKDAKKPRDKFCESLIIAIFAPDFRPRSNSGSVNREFFDRIGANAGAPKSFRTKKMTKNLADKKIIPTFASRTG